MFLLFTLCTEEMKQAPATAHILNELIRTRARLLFKTSVYNAVLYLYGPLMNAFLATSTASLFGTSGSEGGA